MLTWHKCYLARCVSLAGMSGWRLPQSPGWIPGCNTLQIILGGMYMSKFGRLKRAFFEDGMIIETERVSHLKRCVRERRVIEGYFGRVWFRPCDAWMSAF